MKNKPNTTRPPVNHFIEPAKKRKRSRIGRAAQTILDGSFLTREKVIRLIPFILYLMFLAILHVANSYRTEKTWLEINTIKSQMNELRYRYITSKSELMSLGRMSAVSARLQETGLKEATVPPIVLTPQSGQGQIASDHE